ncbi:50S ribosomal protein L31 [Candidatus Gottesmanbacteria bacterium RIFCSPLOWO2_01_FULL_49_10]|uniref:Large ribosomal subunit protein bL31 n=1 Tax=Candidatus Gottesmanbacteria bacterium RIFCSPLOWO2_01_FULL_49_10 TaxID=1798396 RepID=A0A1F6AW40_9BACT|nr:MAG: 50S ribosomal protein L31 [Candidatus Gottesmanbacteria bacterium RIFCSPLOWO2_01_FULL_49_10]
MKSDIHPQWYREAQVLCACGNTFTVGATKQQIQIEICSRCHPFFTGEMKFVDALGRVERFQQKQKSAQATAVILADKKKKKKEKEQQLRSPKSLKEMLMGLR